MATAFTPTVFAPQGRADYRINPVAGVEYKPQDGMTQLNQILDMQSKQIGLQKSQELMQPEIEAGKASSKKVQLEAQKAGVDLNQHFENIKRSTFGGFLTDPDFIGGNKEAMKKKIEASNEYLKSIGVPEMHEGKAHDAFMQMIDKDPKQAYQAIKNGVLQANGPQSQLAQTTPQYVTNAAGQIVGLTSGTNQISAPNEAGGQPQVAPQGQPQGGAPNQVQNQFTQRQSLNPGTAQAGMMNTAAANLSTDFAETQKIASSSEPRIALFQDIKKLAPESFTGVGGARKELAAGILNAVGIPAYEAEKMSTDELAKSSAMLALAGGNTDMARQMAEAANPNKKMNEGAIKDIADKMIGMERMNQAKYNYLKPAQTNPQEYSNRLAEFNKVNDYRIFQESTPEQVAKLKASMSPNEQRIMGEKIKLARQLGLL